MNNLKVLPTSESQDGVCTHLKVSHIPKYVKSWCALKGVKSGTFMAHKDKKNC